jgi:amidase
LARQAPATTSAPAVESLLRAGASLVGKTITDELGFSLEGENTHYGTPRNPRCPDRLPGGSSSGSAVAVAAGLADLGLGTDTGGSVRIPASFCGLFGWRPSHGRVPLDGVVPFAPSYDTVGLLARDASHLKLAAHCLLGTPPAAPRPCRLLFATDAFALAEPEAAAALADAARALGVADDVEIFAGRAADFFEAYATLQGLEIAAALAGFLMGGPRFGPRLAGRDVGALADSAAARHAVAAACSTVHCAAALPARRRRRSLLPNGADAQFRGGPCRPAGGEPADRRFAGLPARSLRCGGAGRR